VIKDTINRDDFDGGDDFIFAARTEVVLLIVIVFGLFEKRSRPTFTKMKYKMK